jgi:hypothetical protein
VSATNKPFGFRVAPVSNPNDAATCANSHFTLGAYAHNASGWQLLGTSVSHGVWYSSSTFSFCTYVNDTSWGSLSVPANAGYDKVRAVGSGYSIQSLKGTPYNSYFPIMTGIFGGSPC